MCLCVYVHFHTSACTSQREVCFLCLPPSMVERVCKYLMLDFDSQLIACFRHGWPRDWLSLNVYIDTACACVLNDIWHWFGLWRWPAEVKYCPGLPQGSKCCPISSSMSCEPLTPSNSLLNSRLLTFLSVWDLWDSALHSFSFKCYDSNMAVRGNDMFCFFPLASKIVRSVSARRSSRLESGS